MKTCSEAGAVTVAVILSCFNRRSKTLEAVGCIRTQTGLDGVTVDLFVLDDGSSDGTGAALRAQHPEVTVLQGDGSLFWNGGMRRAWDAALARDYDFYLWLNDDTRLFPDTLGRMLDTHARCVRARGQAGIVIGSTADEAGRTSYGGERQGGALRPLTLRLLDPTDAVQACDTFNGNCVLVSRRAATTLGNLDGRFVHAMGDTDYGLRAKRAGIPMWLMPGFAGRCVNDNAQAGSYQDASLPLKARLQKMLAPKGLPWRPWLLICRRHAGPLWPLYWAWPYIRVVAGARMPAPAGRARMPKT
jgi:GT2 family glycosyltransferase